MMTTMMTAAIITATTKNCRYQMKMKIKFRFKKLLPFMKLDSSLVVS